MVLNPLPLPLIENNLSMKQSPWYFLQNVSNKVNYEGYHI